MEVSDDEIDGFADLGDSSVSFTATEEEHDELKTATSDPANWMRHLRKVIGNVRQNFVSGTISPRFYRSGRAAAFFLSLFE